MSIFYIIIIALAVIGGVSSLLHFVNSRQNQLDVKVSNREVVELAEEHGGSITTAKLAKSKDLTNSEAKTKLYSMMNKGIFNYGMSSDMQEEFSLNVTVRDALKGHEKPTGFTRNYKKRLNDSEVIKLAAATGGKLTAAVLCMETDISIDQAKTMLDALQEKGVFEVQVTENGSIVYELIDMDLLKNFKK